MQYNDIVALLLDMNKKKMCWGDLTLCFLRPALASSVGCTSRDRCQYGFCVSHCMCSLNLSMGVLFLCNFIRCICVNS